MLKKIVKSTIIIAIISILILSGNIMIALATTQSDLTNIQNKINSTKQDIDQVNRYNH